MERGLIHLYTGDGKGKSTAACGLALRAAGQGLRVLYAQFLKDGDSGEIKLLRCVDGICVMHRLSVKKFFWHMTDAEKEITAADCKALLSAAEEKSGAFDMLVLDELLGCLQCGFLSVEEVLETIRRKPPSLEIVITGRNSPPQLADCADYLSEIHAVKHPYQKNIAARRGIEY